MCLLDVLMVCSWPHKKYTLGEPTRILPMARLNEFELGVTVG